MKKIIGLLLLCASFIFASMNLQTATKEELMSIKGIGEKKADQIMEYRKTNKINSPEDLKNIKGFGNSIVSNVENDTKVSKAKVTKVTKDIKDSKEEKISKGNKDIEEKDYNKAIEQLIEIGIDRVLTSGKKDKAEDAIGFLKTINRLYGNDITFVAAGNITKDNLDSLNNKLDFKEYHGKSIVGYLK